MYPEYTYSSYMSPGAFCSFQIPIAYVVLFNGNQSFVAGSLFYVWPVHGELLLTYVESRRTCDRHTIVKNILM